MEDESDGEPAKKRRLKHATDDNAYRKWLLRLFADTKISARDVCVGAWSMSADVARRSRVDDLSLHPEAQSGKYWRHLKGALKLDAWEAEHIFWEEIPTSTRKKKRFFRKHPFLLPYERIDQDPNCRLKDMKLLELPIYEELKLEESFDVAKLCLGHGYVDGIKISKNTRAAHASMWAWYWTPVDQCRESDNRRLFTFFLSNKACKCGCKGRCTINAIMKVFAWGWDVAESGVKPFKGPKLGLCV